MDFEDIFDHVGTFGLYQVMLYFLLGLISLSGSLQNININFVGGYQEHWCHVPRLAHFPHDVQKHVAIPHDGDDYDSCSFYDLPYDNLTDEDIVSWNRSGLEGVPTKSCENWTFDQSVFVSTIGSEFRLVCDRSWLNQLSSTIFMLGMFVGGLTSGLASDKLGRYKTCVIGLVVNTVAGLVSPFVPEYISFVVVRFLRAASSSWSFLSGFVLVMEVMGPTYRVPLGVLYQVFFSIGFMVVTGIAFAIRDFRWLQLVLALAALPNLLLIGIFPESPMWLIARGRVKEAEDFVRKIAVINQRTLPEDFSLEPEKETKVVHKRPTAGFPDCLF